MGETRQSSSSLKRLGKKGFSNNRPRKFYRVVLANKRNVCKKISFLLPTILNGWLVLIFTKKGKLSKPICSVHCHFEWFAFGVNPWTGKQKQWLFMPMLHNANLTDKLPENWRTRCSTACWHFPFPCILYEHFRTGFKKCPFLFAIYWFSQAILSALIKYEFSFISYPHLSLFTIQIYLEEKKMSAEEELRKRMH